MGAAEPPGYENETFPGVENNILFYRESDFAYEKPYKQSTNIKEHFLDKYNL